MRGKVKVQRKKGQAKPKPVDAEGLWDVCRPWHEAWLRVVQPTVILCLGNGVRESPYVWLGSLLQGLQEDEPLAMYGTYSVKVGRGTLGGQVVTILGGQVKTGQVRTGQNRPAAGARDRFASTLRPPPFATSDGCASCGVRT